MRVIQQLPIIERNASGLNEPDLGRCATSVEVGQWLEQRAVSGVACMAMFRQEKFVKETVNLQKPFAVDPNLRALDLSEAPVADALERLSKALPRIDAEFLRKVPGVDTAELELQHELANEALIGGRRQSAIDRQLIRVDCIYVRLEVVVVLIMGPADVTEAGHAKREQIRAGPELVAIDKARLRLVLYGGVGAGDRVANFFQFGEGLTDPVAFLLPICDRRDESCRRPSFLCRWLCCRESPSDK